MEIFDRWISLGNYCLPKFQINRYIAINYFGLNKNNTAMAHSLIKQADRSVVKKINGSTSAFDWVTIVNYEKALNHISNRLESYELEEENLVEVFDQQGRIINIECRSLGVLYPHLFSSNNDYKFWRNEISALKSKIHRMKTEFVSLEEYNTLYIVLANEQTAFSDFPNQIINALRQSRRSKASHFKLLVCVEGKNTPIDTDAIRYRAYDSTPDVPEYSYHGSAIAWDRVFSGFSLSAYSNLDMVE